MPSNSPPSEHRARVRKPLVYALLQERKWKWGAALTRSCHEQLLNSFQEALMRQLVGSSQHLQPVFLIVDCFLNQLYSGCLLSPASTCQLYQLMNQFRQRVCSGFGLTLDIRWKTAESCGGYCTIAADYHTKGRVVHVVAPFETRLESIKRLSLSSFQHSSSATPKSSCDSGNLLW